MASPQGIFLTQGSKPQTLMSPALAARFFTTRAPWEAQKDHKGWEKKKQQHEELKRADILRGIWGPSQFSSVQSLSRVRLFATPWIAARQASLSITNSRSSLRLTSIESVMPSSRLFLCRPLLLLPPIPPSIRVFSKESTLHMRWPKYWSFSFSIIPSKEIPGLIFRMDWLDLLAVQGTLKSLLQHHSSKAPNLWRSAFFTVQLSHPYMTTGKTIALTRRTFVGKVMSLLLNMLSRLVITPRDCHTEWSKSDWESETDLQRTNLWLQGKGWGDGHAAILKMDNQQGPIAEHRELCAVFCVSLDGRGVGGEWLHVHVWLDHFAVHLKVSQRY